VVGVAEAEVVEGAVAPLPIVALRAVCLRTVLALANDTHAQPSEMTMTMMTKMTMMMTTMPNKSSLSHGADPAVCS